MDVESDKELEMLIRERCVEKLPEKKVVARGSGGIKPREGTR